MACKAAATPGSYPGGGVQGGLPYPGYPPGLSTGGARGSQSGIIGSDAYQARPGFRSDLLQRREPRPPPPPSEFQKFVERATGRMLPVFGSTFFSEAADSFNPIDNVPVAPDYIVGPGDEINIRAWGSVDVDYWATVDRNGMLNLPKIGSFSVAGVKASELERHLRAQIGRLYTNFNLSVALGQLRAVKVFVVGPALRPGVYTLPSQSTMLSAMVAAGGPSPNGSMRHVSLRRDGRIVSELDIYEFLGKGDKSKDLQLAPGDVIVFQPAGPQVALNGAVDTRAIYELKTAQELLRDVLRYAGGAPVLANPNRVQLERIDPARPTAARYVEEFRLDEAGLAKPLQDGDVLTLLQISPQFANAVTLRGHVAQPLRYPYSPGMRIRDLIPDREALISPDFYRRKNMLVQVIEDEEPTRGGRTGRDESGDATRRDSRTGELRDGTSPAVRDSGQIRNLPGGLGPRDANGVLLLDEQSRAATLDRQRGTDTSTRAGDVNVPRDAANRPLKSPTALFDDLNWDYAVIERLNLHDLSTQVIPFNLGKAILQNDEANNIALMPGDVVTIFSQKDVRGPVARQTRLVSLEGEINSPGVYQLRAGETLRQLLVRAGGFTPQAYVYGLELSREETRQRQRENLRTAIARLSGPVGGAERARSGEPPRRSRRRGSGGGGEQRRHPGAARAAEPDRAERPDRARARPRDRSPRGAARSAARERRPHQRAVAPRLRDRRRRGGQQQRLRLERRPHRRAIPRTRRPRRGGRSVQHVHPARRRHRHQGGRAARLVQPRRPRGAGDATGRRADRAEPARLRDLGPRPGTEPEGLLRDLLGLRLGIAAINSLNN